MTTISRDKFKIGDQVALSTEGLAQRFQARRGVVVGFVSRKIELVRIKTNARKGHKSGVGTYHCRYWDKVLQSDDELPPNFGNI